MKKLTGKEISTLLLVFGVGAVVASHMMVYTPNMDEVELLEVQIATQQTEVTRLKDLEAQLPVMEEEISNSQIIVENEMKKYPEEVLVEGFVMFAEDMRNDLEVDIYSVAIAAPTLLSQLEIIRSNENGSVVMPMATYRTSLTMPCDFTYSQLKTMVQYIHSGSYRTVLNSISFAYNASTAQLSGSVDVNKYFVATPNYQYVPTVIPLVPVGTNNPFGTAG